MAFEDVGEEKAAQYFASGGPLFAELERFEDSRMDKIRKEIDSVRAELA